MKAIITPDMEHLAALMKAHAENGIYMGNYQELESPYFSLAKQVHLPTGTQMIFTRDAGHHTLGWFKNPDYERCYHLSMSFWDIQQQVSISFDHRQAEAWCKCFFGDWLRYIWEEGPTPESQVHVRHFRVFCDPAWQPLLPRKEVYTPDFIEKGWKSWSDRNYLKRKGIQLGKK